MKKGPYEVKKKPDSSQMGMIKISLDSGLILKKGLSHFKSQKQDLKMCGRLFDHLYFDE